MNVVFFGLGSIGRRHARLLRKLFPEFRLHALRSGNGAAAGPDDLGIAPLSGWDDVARLGGGVAFITNPTGLHVKTALECARRGLHLFLEKPIGSSREGLDELAGLLERRRLVSYVAYNLRFHPLIRRLKDIVPTLRIRAAEAESASWLPDWRPGTDHLACYSARSDLGGGALLDLSHEIDYVGHLFGDVRSIRGRLGRRADVTVDAEDFAELELATGAVPSVKVRLDVGSRERRRGLVLHLEGGGTVRADLLASTIAGPSMPTPIALPCAPDEPYEAQLRHFFAGLVAGGRGLMNSVPEAMPLFEKIVAFKEAA